MLIYIDSDFKCHTTNVDGRCREFEIDFFDGKCARLIEGYRFVPEGETWTRDDGEVFMGEMISPCRDYDIISELQNQYEETQSVLSDMANALEILGVTA